MAGIPEPKPGDLQNPVPGAPPPPPDLDSFMASQPKGNPAQADQSAPSGGQPTPPPDLDNFMSGNSSDNQPAPPPISDVAAGENPVLPQKGMLDMSDKERSSYLKSVIPNLKKNFDELVAVAKAGIHKDPDDQLASLKKSFGKDNAIMIGDSAYFRGDANSSWRPVNETLASSMDKGSPGSILNMLASHSRDLPFAAGAAATGGVAGAAGLVGDSILGAAAAGAASGAGGSASAQLADNATNEDGTTPLTKDLLGESVKGAIGGATIGGAIAAAPVAADMANSLVNKINPYFEGQESRLGKILTQYKNITDVAVKSGMNVDTAAPEMDSTSIGEDLAGKTFSEKDAPIGRLQELKRDLSKQIGAVVDHADSVAGDKKFDMGDPISKIQSKMEKGGIIFKPGQIEVPRGGVETDSPISKLGIIPSELNYEDLDSSIKDDLHDILNKEPQPRFITVQNKAQVPQRGAAPFGEPNSSVINDMVTRYNDLLLKNHLNDGFAPSEIANTTHAWQDLGSFDRDLNVKSDAVKSFYRSASDDLASHRDNVLQQLSSDAPPEIQSSMNNAYKNYSQKIPYIQDYLKDFGQKNSAADFADSLLSTQNKYQKVNFLKTFLGEGSPEWSDIKGRWFANVLDKNLDQNFLDAKGVQKDLDAYRPDVLNQLIDPSDQKSLKVSLSQLSKIPTTDFTKNEQAPDFTKYVIAKVLRAPLAAGASAANMASKILFNVTKENGPLADWMAKDGLYDLAKNATNPSEKAGWLNAADKLNSGLSMVYKVPSDKVGYKYVPRPEFIQSLNALWSQPSTPAAGSPQQATDASPYQRPTIQPHPNGTSRFSPVVSKQDNLGSVFGR